MRLFRVLGGDNMAAVKMSVCLAMRKTSAELRKRSRRHRRQFSSSIGSSEKTIQARGGGARPLFLAGLAFVALSLSLVAPGAILLYPATVSHQTQHRIVELIDALFLRARAMDFRKCT